jgi:alkylhydroperoxidase/carboxymuconolactone decarboxylase family protein YurZ
MEKKLPPSITEFESKYPGISKAFAALGKACHEEGGPLDEKTRRLVKLGIAIGNRHEGAVHSAVRHAVASGITRDEVYHAAVLAITTLGWPASYAAMTWIADGLEGSTGVPRNLPD